MLAAAGLVAIAGAIGFVTGHSDGPPGKFEQGGLDLALDHVQIVSRTYNLFYLAGSI